MIHDSHYRRHLPCLFLCVLLLNTAAAVARTNANKAGTIRVSKVLSERTGIMTGAAVVPRCQIYDIKVVFNDAAAQGARASATKWDYLIVSTPDFLGPFRGNDPTFRAPLPIDVAQPAVDSSRKGVIGVLEVIVSADGTTRVETTLRTSGSKSRKRIREVVSRWRFEPARLDGQAIRVRLRVTVSNENPH